MSNQTRAMVLAVMLLPGCLVLACGDDETKAYASYVQLSEVSGRILTEAPRDLQVATNPMSTQVRGEYETVMAALTKEIGTTFGQVPKAVFAIRILNNPIAGGTPWKGSGAPRFPRRTDLRRWR